MRRIVDRDLLEWDAWAVPARSGRPDPGRIAFRCLTDPGRRPRTVPVGESRAEAEALLARASPVELREWFDRAEPLL